jgi:nucleotide-binding universal stress UspA family protein
MDVHWSIPHGLLYTYMYGRVNGDISGMVRLSACSRSNGIERGLEMRTDRPVRRVIVDIDEPSESAIEWARLTADSLGVPLIAWATVQRQSAERSPDDEARFESDRAQAAHEWLLERSIDVDEVRVAVGDRDVELVNQTGPGDVVVVGIDRSEGLSGWALGSRAHGLAHELSCPLVVVPPGELPTNDAPVIVGVDGTDANACVVEWAESIALLMHRPCREVFAYKPIYDTFDNEGDYGSDELAARQQARVRSSPITEVPGDPSTVLIAEASGGGAFLTVVGARSEHSLDGLLLGSVPDHLLHTAPGPVAIITYASLS